MFRQFIRLSFLCFFLSACVQKTDSSLVFSPDNFPDLVIKVNEGADYVNDPNIQVTFDSSRDDIESISLVLGDTCADADWKPASEVTSFTLAGDDGEKAISMKVKTQYGFVSKCVIKKLILDRAAPVTTDSIVRFSQAKLSSLTQSPTILWAPAQDSLSGVAYYEYSIGSTPNSFDVLPWTKLEKVTEATALNLNLANKGNYFPSIRAIDKAGNVGTPFGSQSWLVDMDPPTIASVLVPANGSYRGGQILSFKVSWSKNVIVTGAPQIALNIGSQTRYASYISGSGTRDLIFRYTVLGTDNDSDGISVQGLELNGGKVEDEANNSAILTTTYPATGQVIVDNTSPTVLSVGKPANGSYRSGQNLIFTLQYSEVIQVTGTPRIPVVVGATTRYANYTSGTGTATLTFQYTIQAGDNDNNGISINALELNSGTITDVAGNGATNTFAAPNTSSVLVDTTSPTISSAQGPATGDYTNGQVLSFQINFSESVTVTGSPQLSLTIGSNSRYATYNSGSGTNQLTFNYMIVSGDEDDLITMSSMINLNGGTIADSAGNASGLSFTNPNLSGVLVNYASVCPGGFVRVPALSPYTTTDFCVAKYEMKIQGVADGNVSYAQAYIAESRATGNPWVNISRDNAISECQALGAKYDLISNAQWQSIARNIESVTWNWSGGSIGNSGGLSRGYSPPTVTVDASLAADSDDNKACLGTGATCSLSTWNALRRVHKLSNGFYLWDLAGNVTEWVKDNNTTSLSADEFIVNISPTAYPTIFSIEGLSGNAKFHFGPSGSYNLTTFPYGNLGRAYNVTTVRGTIHRGGHWGINAGSGIFTVDLGWSGVGNVVAGFRCTYIP